MEFAVTVIGRDRVGIVAEVAGRLAELGANLTDSRMTILHGHFAMTLICTAPAAEAQLRQALAPVSDGGLMVSVAEVEADRPTPVGGSSYVVSVHGADRLGIVAAVARAIADAGGNITDLSTRLTDNLYVLVAEVDLPGGAADGLAKNLLDLATSLHVEVNLRPAEADLL